MKTRMLLSLLFVFGSVSCKVEQEKSEKSQSSVGRADALSRGSLLLNPCAILDGNVKCWGENQIGQLGLGDTNHRGDQSGEMGTILPEVNLGSVSYVTAVATSNAASSCALLFDGTVKCWGSNTVGQLGLGDLNEHSSPSALGDNLQPVDLGTGVIATQITAGSRHFCALTSDGNVKCWGTHTQYSYFAANPGFVGDDPSDMGDNLAPVSLPIGRIATQVAAGAITTCAILDDQTVFCWAKQCNPTNGSYSGPNFTCTDNMTGTATPNGVIPLGSPVQSVSLGGNFGCALLVGGRVKCWGDNSGGQLGRGDRSSFGYDAAHLPDIATMETVDLGTGRTAVEISAGGYHVCARLNDNSVKCWGTNSSGQLGVGDTADRGDEPGEMGDNLPTVNLGTDRTAKSISAGVVQTCALLDDDSVKCWGFNGDGRLGQGNTINWGGLLSTMGDYLPAIALW